MADEPNVKKARATVWMPLYVADYLGDTMHLTTEQHGAYLLLLMASWKNGGAVSSSPSQLQTITRLDAKKWKSAEGIISKFFFVTETEWIHNRVRRELIKAKTNSEKRAESGKNGAAKRWQEHGKKMANAIANASQNDGPSPSPFLPTVELVTPASQAKTFSQDEAVPPMVVDSQTGEVISWAA